MAGGCYSVRAVGSGNYLVRQGTGFAASASAAQAAEPLHFQATDLGKYLLFDTTEHFLAAEKGPAETLSDAVQPATDRAPINSETDLPRSVNDDLPSGGTAPVPDQNTIGNAVVSADEPSKAADLEIVDAGGGAFTITLPATGRVLTASPSGELAFAAPPAGESAKFAFQLKSGCATWPEADINVTGAPVKGETFFSEVRGFIDGHLHTMAYEFLGGRARCGRPWHRFGVTKALVDCPDHEPGGYGAILENVVSHKSPGATHDTVGWPTFRDWPAHDSLTHEGVYYRWLERAWRGGERFMVTLLVDNNVLCEVYPYKRNSCNEMDGVRLQAKRLHEFQDYIDAQSGGPGEGWLRIVKDPYEARRVMNQGKLAVLMGIEVSVLFDCGEVLEVPSCSDEQIDQRLAEVHDMGVRQMEFVNKFDSGLSGVAGDSGDTGLLVNTANFDETGHWWKMNTCNEPEGHDHHAHDKTQHNLVDHGLPREIGGRDALAGAILELSGTSGAAPLYSEGPHCNAIGLSSLGEHLLDRMAERGMIFDPDHMSAKGRDMALDVLEQKGYSGVMSSHSWADDTSYPRIYKLGGFVTPYAGDSTGFVGDWRTLKPEADPRFFFGFGFGADMNGFGAQGGPRGADVPNPVTYPFDGFGGTKIDRQTSGQRVYDLNSDGVAHYGLYPDWIEDLRILAGDQGGEIVHDMTRGPEAYLQMWERATGIAPNACHSEAGGVDRAKLQALAAGTSNEDVLKQVGQPDSRIGYEYRYCVANPGHAPGHAAAVFDSSGRLQRVTFDGDRPPPPSVKDCASRRDGTSSGNRMDGTSGGDQLRGLGGNDVLRGGGGNDCLFGNSGNDAVYGGAGNDELHGNSGADRLYGSAGRDHLEGGAGNDRLSTRDGVRESVECGGGRDIAIVDRGDRVSGCERVYRR
jgi:hypothetical protein